MNNGTGSEKKTNTPFRRVNVEQVEIARPDLRDNSFNSKRGFDRWGEQAAAKLSTVRGKDFRREKTKKKRGSYGGGPINMGVNSIKFA
nr:nucleolar and coiled-body phosphoprotein 1-like [Dermatophagoides farinae]